MAKKVAKVEKSGKGMDAQPAIVGWFKSAYPDHVKLDVKNGIVYQAKIDGAHRKVVKEPTLENKGGVFFGSRLNGPLAKVKGAIHHTKSNVYKVPGKVSPATVKAIRIAIVSILGKPACSVEKGLVKDKPVTETTVETPATT